MQVSVTETSYPDSGDQLISESYDYNVGKGEIKSFFIHPTAIGVDIPTQLFLELLSWKNSLVTDINIQVTELQDFEKRIEKINAVEEVFGMLNDFTSEQLTTFETSVKRRQFF